MNHQINLTLSSSEYSPFSRGGRIWSTSHHQYVMQLESTVGKQYKVWPVIIILDDDRGKLWRFSALFQLEYSAHTIYTMIQNNAVRMQRSYTPQGTLYINVRHCG